MVHNNNQNGGCLNLNVHWSSTAVWFGYVIIIWVDEQMIQPVFVEHLTVRQLKKVILEAAIRKLDDIKGYLIIKIVADYFSFHQLINELTNCCMFISSLFFLVPHCCCKFPCLGTNKGWFYFILSRLISKYSETEYLYKSRLGTVQWDFWLLFLVIWNLRRFFFHDIWKIFCILKLAQGLDGRSSVLWHQQTWWEFTAVSDPPGVKSVTRPGLAAPRLMTDSGFNIWWGTWDEPKVGLTECVMQGTPKPSAIVIPPSCPAIHRGYKVLHSHCEFHRREKHNEVRITKVTIMWAPA